MTYESTAEPIKIGYLTDFLLSDDYPKERRDDLTIPFGMVLGDALDRGHIDRPIEVVYREVEGLRATQTSSLPGQNRRRQMRPVGVVLNVGRGSLELNVAGRLADGFRAGRLIRCESRRCGGDRHGGNTRRQQWCDVLQFHFHGGTP